MLAELLQKRQEHDIRELNIALNEFRMLHQQPSSRREWDLYDPDALKKDRPARVCDDDPRCGISSLQKFDGEDLNNKARRKFMEEQRRLWAEQQLRERRQVYILPSSTYALRSAEVGVCHFFDCLVSVDFFLQSYR